MASNGPDRPVTRGEDYATRNSASEGIGIGKVMLIEEHSLEYTPRTVTDTEAESHVLRQQ